MKRQPREVYGYGAKLPPVNDRAAKLARGLLVAFVVATLLAYALVRAGGLKP